jgi:hypothetical protein
MSYPYGPEAGRFAGTPYVAGAAAVVSGAAAPATVFPQVMPVQAKFDAARGYQVATFPGPAGSVAGWALRRITVSCSFAPVQALLYVGQQIDKQNLVDGTSRGDLDVSEWIVPPRVVTGDRLFVAFVGTDSTDTAWARLEYFEVLS